MYYLVFLKVRCPKRDSFVYKDPYAYGGESLPLQITAAKSLLLSKVIYSQGLGIRTWTSLGAIHQPSTGTAQNDTRRGLAPLGTTTLSPCTPSVSPCLFTGDTYTSEAKAGLFTNILSLSKLLAVDLTGLSFLGLEFCFFFQCSLTLAGITAQKEGIEELALFSGASVRACGGWKGPAAFRVSCVNSFLNMAVNFQLHKGTSWATT